MRSRPRSRFGERRREQGVGVDILEGLVDGARCDRLGDAGRLDAAAAPAACPRLRSDGLGARDRAGDALIVEAAVGLETRDGRVDRLPGSRRGGRDAGGPALRTARAARASSGAARYVS